MKADRNNDLVCLSHLRWDFVYQRPQHLMTRYGRWSPEQDDASAPRTVFLQGNRIC